MFKVKRGSLLHIRRISARAASKSPDGVSPTCNPRDLRAFHVGASILPVWDANRGRAIDAGARASGKSGGAGRRGIRSFQYSNAAVWTRWPLNSPDAKT